MVELDEFRARRRLSEYRARIARVLDSNRRAIGRLHSSGALFSRQGVRAGRDLLLAHEHLLRVMTLLDKLSTGEARRTRVEAVYAELEALLERTSELTVKTGTYLARLRGE